MTETEMIPGVCDICLVHFEFGSPVYVYETPSTGTFEESQRGEAFWAEDPLWGLCEDCHQRTQAYDNGFLSKREYLAISAREANKNKDWAIIGPPEAVEELQRAYLNDHVFPTLDAFLDRRSPGWIKEANVGIPRSRS